MAKRRTAGYVIGLMLVAAIVLSATAPYQRAYAARGDRGSAWAEEWLLARLIHAEAEGEPYAGRVAVGAVVLNRVESPLFPATVSGVIFEPGAFSPVYDGRINLLPDQSSLNAARDALMGWDPSFGALYFYNPAKTTSWWIFTRPITTRIGNHIFAR
ncbi:MAG TPA: spore cortex-lytic protein [Firmicutes bacterium]|nr:spore cortex-lytic protein [Bacillota bacterium]